MFHAFLKVKIIIIIEGKELHLVARNVPAAEIQPGELTLTSPPPCQQVPAPVQPPSPRRCSSPSPPGPDGDPPSPCTAAQKEDTFY